MKILELRKSTWSRSRSRISIYQKTVQDTDEAGDNIQGQLQEQVQDAPSGRGGGTLWLITASDKPKHMAEGLAGISCQCMPMIWAVGPVLQVIYTIMLAEVDFPKKLVLVIQGFCDKRRGGPAWPSWHGHVIETISLFCSNLYRLSANQNSWDGNNQQCTDSKFSNKYLFWKLYAKIQLYLPNKYGQSYHELRETDHILLNGSNVWGKGKPNSNLQNENISFFTSLSHRIRLRMAWDITTEMEWDTSSTHDGIPPTQKRFIKDSFVLILLIEVLLSLF